MTRGPYNFSKRFKTGWHMPCGPFRERGNATSESCACVANATRACSRGISLSMLASMSRYKGLEAPGSLDEGLAMKRRAEVRSVVLLTPRASKAASSTKTASSISSPQIGATLISGCTGSWSTGTKPLISIAISCPLSSTLIPTLRCPAVGFVKGRMPSADASAAPPLAERTRALAAAYTRRCEYSSLASSSSGNSACDACRGKPDARAPCPPMCAREGRLSGKPARACRRRSFGGIWEERDRPAMQALANVFSSAARPSSLLCGDRTR